MASSLTTYQRLCKSPNPRPLWEPVVACMDKNNHQVILRGLTCLSELGYREDVLWGADQLSLTCETKRNFLFFSILSNFWVTDKNWLSKNSLCCSELCTQLDRNSNHAVIVQNYKLCCINLMLDRESCPVNISHFYAFNCATCTTSLWERGIGVGKRRPMVVRWGGVPYSN